MVRFVDQEVTKLATEKVLWAAGWACYYCEARWASVVDHVRPAAQEGSSAEGNLVAACERCNAQKSGKTPAAWKAWRLARGMSWPPPNLSHVFGLFLDALTDTEKEALDRITRADDTRFWDFERAFMRRYHRGDELDFERDRAELTLIVNAFAAERDV